ncbi:uncharacterized protein LOC133814182 [Humulus lupulus]|uniref:uncharacterized protein LOC133814182 n=1 Tax=Humulus lupulus TaxID=3486 RepID=UPI002B417602|nr:uncharacterized protein LOC133814182 [Humulus lupulus]
MPSYVKFLKEILSKKRKMKDYETVALREECSAILQRKLPQKLRDPGSFTIPCTIGNFKLGLGEARPTTVTLQLANRSIKHHRGIIEDVLVKVDKFIFLGDFIVLDIEEDADVSIILGRPFLAMGQKLIDVQKGELRLRVQGDEVVFNVFKAMSYHKASDNCFSIDVIERVVSEKNGSTDALEVVFKQYEEDDSDDVEVMDYVKWVNSYGPY